MATTNGWIKISRNILNHWIAQDPERLKWWLDLILMAAHTEVEQYYKGRRYKLSVGSVHASASYLSTRWKRDVKTVRRFLKILESEGMIKRTIVEGLISIITICKYAVYQSSENEQTEGSTDIQMDASTEALLPVQKGVQLESQMDNGTDDRRETKQELNNIYTSTTSTIEAQAPKNWIEREKFFAEHFQSPECAEQFKAGREALEVNIVDYQNFLRKFVDECIGKQRKHKDFNDFTAHFYDWTRIQLNRQREAEARKLPRRGTGAWSSVMGAAQRSTEVSRPANEDDWNTF